MWACDVHCACYHDMLEMVCMWTRCAWCGGSPCTGAGRPTMITYGVDNIRDLFGHKVKLSMSKGAPIVRLDKARVK